MTEYSGRLDWTGREHHLRRSERHLGDTDIEPLWADEAFADPDGVVFSPDPASKSGASDKMIGYSPSAGMVITVIYLRDGHRGLTA